MRFFWNILLLTLGLLMMQNSLAQDYNSSELSQENLHYLLGETNITIERYSHHDTSELLYFHPHDSEPTSFMAGKDALQKYGGTLVRIKNNGVRNVSFSIKGVKYTVDPNRIYTREGIAATLKKYGPYSQEAEDKVYQFSQWLSGVLTAQRVFAIHNNRDQGYNVLSYSDKDGKPAQGVKALHINADLDPGNFIYTTNLGLFMAAKAAGFNVVLQATDVIDDGSYSVFAMKKGLDYINVESKIGDAQHDAELIAVVNRYYNIAPLEQKTWPVLKFGDRIDLVATSSAYDEKNLVFIKEALEESGLEVRTRFAQQGENQGLGYSNTDEMRRKQFVEALKAPDSQAVWGIRGGSGTTNFLPAMVGVNPDFPVKPVIGFSDVTGAHLFLNNKWGWPTIHGVLAEFNQEVDAHDHNKVNYKTSISSVINLLMGQQDQVSYSNLVPLNDHALKSSTIETKLIGGNITLVTTSLSTTLQPTQAPFTLILEGVGNSPHQLERMFDQIAYSDMMEQVQAVILGEFIKSEEGDHAEVTNLNNLVVKRFAQKLEIPAFRLDSFGHGAINNPVPLGTKAMIVQGSDKKFTLSAKSR